MSQTKPNHFILHVGTNCFNWNGPPDKVAKTIVDFASELKSKKFDTSISSITVRADKFTLNENGSKVKHHLNKMCNRNFFSHWSLQKDQRNSSE